MAIVIGKIRILIDLSIPLTLKLCKYVYAFPQNAHLRRRRILMRRYPFCLNACMHACNIALQHYKAECPCISTFWARARLSICSSRTRCVIKRMFCMHTLGKYTVVIKLIFLKHIKGVLYSFPFVLHRHQHHF